jgi:hypothetical protein
MTDVSVSAGGGYCQDRYVHILGVPQAFVIYNLTTNKDVNKIYNLTFVFILDRDKNKDGE